MTIKSHYQEGFTSLVTLVLAVVFLLPVTPAAFIYMFQNKSSGPTTLLNSSTKNVVQNQIPSVTPAKNKNFITNSPTPPISPTAASGQKTNTQEKTQNNNNPTNIPVASPEIPASTLAPVSNKNTSSGSLVIDRSSVNVSLYKDNADGGLIYGQGFTIFSTGATGWQIKYNEPTQGQGFYESSGGISPTGSAVIRSYINPNKFNGVYTGSAVVQYYKDDNWHDGPTVSYTITLFGPANSSATSNPTPTLTPVPTFIPSSTPASGGCTPVSFSESKSGDTITVTVSGAWWLSVKSSPNYTSADFDQNQKTISLHFNVPNGTISVYQASYTGAPLCQTYQFGAN